MKFKWSRWVIKARIRRNQAKAAVNRFLVRHAKTIVGESFDLLGLALIAVGVGLIYLPAGVILGGVGALIYRTKGAPRFWEAERVQRYERKLGGGVQ